MKSLINVVSAIAILVAPGFSQEPEVTATGTKPIGFEIGTTEQNLQWMEKGDPETQLAHIDAMADAGAKWVRLTLRKPFAPCLLAHIKRANELGVKVMVHLESDEHLLYPPGTRKRPGNHGQGGCAWDSYRLSELDLTLCEAFVREFFELLKAENATVSAIEMFNEINWNAFNGDLPLADGGLWIDDSTPWDDPVFVKYRAGLEKTGRLTKIVSDLNRELLGGKVRIITSGMVGGFYDWKSSPKLSGWMAKIKGAVVSHALTLRLMRGTDSHQIASTDYLEFVDGIGIHIYPQAGERNLSKVIGLHFDPAGKVPEVGLEKPFWITEAGYLRRDFPDDTKRLKELERLCRALDTYDRSKGDIATVFLHNFSSGTDEAGEFGMWENGSLLPAGAIFKSFRH